MLRFGAMIFGVLLIGFAWAQEIQPTLSIGGFQHWLTGHDQNTVQLIPAKGSNALAVQKSIVVAHVKFSVKQYGEMSFPINIKSVPEQEALKQDLSNSKFIEVTYRSNQSVILQLRQTGVHGGTHNHVVLPPTNTLQAVTIYFSEFKGGLKPLDLSDVAKFNFAFLANNEKDGFAELIVENFQIDQFKP